MGIRSESDREKGSRMGSRAAGTLGVIALVLGSLTIGFAPAASAQVDVIDDIMACHIYAAPPGVSDYEVQGYGGSSSGCKNVPGFVGTLVCLDYNYVTVANSCRSYSVGTGGPTAKVPCVPGVWLTQVTPMGIFGPIGSNTHSFPSVIVNNCLRPVDVGP